MLDKKEYNNNWYKNNKDKHYKTQKMWKKDNGLQLKSKSIWNGENNQYDLENFLNDKGVVYFIGDIHKQYVKIGITNSIFSISHRFRTIQGNNPIQLTLHGFIQDTHNRKLEKQLHEKFKQYHKVGEWFYLVPEITRYVEQNCMKIELANTLFGETYMNKKEIY